MQEDFLHYIWQFKKFDFFNLKTIANEPILINHVGLLNTNSGPDFFNAKIKIAEQLWAGNVEIHSKSYDWYVHNHEKDIAYDSVILHVVWEHDVEVFRKDNSPIPTLELKNYVFPNALEAYKTLFSNSNIWINCENEIGLVDEFLINNWLEKLYIERLEQKALKIKEYLEVSQNDWQAILFKLLAKNFGLKVNGDAFLQLAHQTPFQIIRKNQNSLEYLEALLFGQANLLKEDVQDAYLIELQKNYSFLKQKYQLGGSSVQIQFFRLRPNNFPTIRISQLATLYHLQSNLFIKLMEAQDLSEIYAIFRVQASAYWDTHFTFGKTATNSKHLLSKSFIDLLIINTIIPIKFAYLKSKGHDSFENLFHLLKQIKSEKNSIIDKFQTLKISVNSALDSQALIQLKNNYCDKNKCLHCAVGNHILQQKE